MVAEVQYEQDVRNCQATEPALFHLALRFTQMQPMRVVHHLPHRLQARASRGLLLLIFHKRNVAHDANADPARVAGQVSDRDIFRIKCHERLGIGACLDGAFASDPVCFGNGLVA